MNLPDREGVSYQSSTQYIANKSVSHQPFHHRACVVIHPSSEVETDADGIRSDSLRSILESWPSGKPKPRILYTIPVRRHFELLHMLTPLLCLDHQYGCNPTGRTANLERRRETLRLAHEHDFIILEGILLAFSARGYLPNWFF